MADYAWYCDRCGAFGEIRITAREGAWSGVDRIMRAHRVEDSMCDGGTGSVRVYTAPRWLSEMDPRRKQAVASGRARRQRGTPDAAPRAGRQKTRSSAASAEERE